MTLDRARWDTGLTFAGIGASWLIYAKLIKGWWEVGYQAGRHDVLDSQANAFRQGVTFGEWVLAELERDGFTRVQTNEEGNGK